MKLSLMLAFASFCLVVYGCYDAPPTATKRGRVRSSSRAPEPGDASAAVAQVLPLEHRARDRSPARRYR
ncbi:MAG: hypothetical protein VKQ33_03850 [Candidatus Sericytochromatia bacterium]|nr:hypothetical protein [Candidatus Sericytochromatia bacterium]